MQSITEFSFFFRGCGCKEIQRGKRACKESIEKSSSIIMEFCYFFYFCVNPTRKHKTREEKPGETGTKIKFVNEIYKQGFSESIGMHKIDSVFREMNDYVRQGHT